MEYDPKNHKYKVITMCGSTKFEKEFIECWRQLTLEGNVVFMIAPFWREPGQRDFNEDVLEMFQQIHFQKIKMSDAIFVVNPGGYIGESTAKEIAKAREWGKEILYLEKVDNPKFMSHEELENLVTDVLNE